MPHVEAADRSMTASVTGPTADQMPVSGREVRHPPLGVQLIATGLVTTEQVDLALAEQRRTGRRLGEILVAHDLLFEDDLARTLADLPGCPTGISASIHPTPPSWTICPRPSAGAGACSL